MLNCRATPLPVISHSPLPTPHSPPIAAIATAQGTAALAIVRVAGGGAVETVARRFSRPDALREAPSHTALVGWIVDADGARVDQVVATVFRAPRSATGDDTVEVTTHGGSAAPQAVLRALLDAGAEPAAPGAFTQRAFLAGKLDLAQAEAVADLIHAESQAARRVAVRGLDGHLSALVGEVREALLETAALVELELDFAEEDVAFADRAQLAALLDRADGRLDALLATSRLGALVRDGVRVAIGGRPNVGKSTLLNALVERDRAIVADQPGTTRDAVEAERELDGLRFRFVDTAGLRETADAVEAEGVRRSRAEAEAADVLLYVADARTGPDAEERASLDRLAAGRPDLPILRLAGKADLLAPGAAAPDGWLPVSAQRALADPSELDALRARLVDAARGGAAEASVVVANERHRRLLVRTREAVGRARAGLAAGTPGDLLALDLRAALDALGRITGAITPDDVLGAVFSRFCIGK